MSSDNKEILDTLKDISKTLENLKRVTDIMAQASIASVVYSKNTLQTLLAEYASLIQENSEAFNQLHEAMDNKDQPNESETQQQFVRNLLQERKSTMAKVDAFRKKYPVIASLHNSMTSIPK